MIIIGGIPPGSSGTGVVMSHLVNTADSLNMKVRFIFAPDRRMPFFPMFFQGRALPVLYSTWKRISQLARFTDTLGSHAVIDDDLLLLVHPQTIGFKRCLSLIRRRKKPVWLFLMDAGFFCIRSYNYISGENQPCKRCLGKANMAGITEHNCKAFPAGNNHDALIFIKELQKYASMQHVGILAQNTGQAELARKHFGERAIIRVCGIWGADWATATDGKTGRSIPHHTMPSYDVVYHGSQHPAKGAYWAIELAQRCPDMTFLFPFDRDCCKEYIDNGVEVNRNIDFIPLRWNTGLSDAVSNARMVLLPSLWSAPVEGALIKSIPVANAVGVVNNPTAFSAEISDDMVLHLSANIELAQKELTAALAGQQKTTAAERMQWYETFIMTNRGLLERLIRSMSG